MPLFSLDMERTNEAIAKGAKYSITSGYDSFWDHFVGEPKEERCFYEILLKDTPTHLYVDLDTDKTMNPGLDATDLCERVMGEVKSLLVELGACASEEEITLVTLDSSNEKKLSKHYLFKLPNNKYFANNFHCGAFVRRMKKRVLEKYGQNPEENPFYVLKREKGRDSKTRGQMITVWDFPVDEGVYTRNRVFRTYGSTKRDGDFRPLLTEGEELSEDWVPKKKNFFDCLVQYVPNPYEYALFHCKEEDGTEPTSRTKRKADDLPDPNCNGNGEEKRTNLSSESTERDRILSISRSVGVTMVTASGDYPLEDRPIGLRAMRSPMVVAASISAETKMDQMGGGGGGSVPIMMATSCDTPPADSAIALRLARSAGIRSDAPTIRMHPNWKRDVTASGYYHGAFPCDALFSLFGRGKADREFGVQDADGVMRRHLKFGSLRDFRQMIHTWLPSVVHLGSIGETGPSPTKELVFDIDMDSYGKDERRTCCGSEKKVCEKCWKYAKFCIRMLEGFLKDYGFDPKSVFFFFSGMKGIHCWVTDERATGLSKRARRSLLDDLDIRRVGVCGGDERRAYVKEALRDSGGEEYYEKCLREDQGLGERLNRKIDEKGRTEAVLDFIWPEFDDPVTTDVKHLTKMPFCLHSSTKRPAIYLRSDSIPDFDALSDRGQIEASVRDFAHHVSEFIEKQHR